MRTTTTYFYLCFLILSVVGNINAQDHIQFKNYTINDGLSQSVVSSIIQDDLGALWLGTQDGINRFNGKNFEVFSADKGYEISNEYIHVSTADQQGNLWFGTYNGLTKYNPKTVEFTAYKSNRRERLEIHAIAEDNNGDLWLGTGFGKIYYFDTEKETFKLVDESSFDSRIVDIEIKEDQLIVVSEFEGVLIASRDFKEKRTYKPQVNDPEDFVINGLIDHPSRSIVVATNQGAFYFDQKQQKFLPYTKMFGEIGALNIVDALYLNEQKVLIATENSGLFQVTSHQSDSLSVLNYTADFFQKGSLISNKISGLYRDNQGIIWIASQRGLSSFDPDHLGFRGVGFSGNLDKGLPSQNIWGFSEDRTGQFLFVAADHGISMYDRNTRNYYHYMREARNNEDHTTLCLYVLSSNKLLVGSVDGLFELTIDQDNFASYEFKKIAHSIDNQRGFDKTYTIVPYEDSTYLVGTRAGVAVLDYTSKTFQYIYNQPNAPQSIGPGPCRLIFSTKAGNYYVAPSSGGLYQFKRKDDAISVNRPKAFDVLHNATNDYFTSFCQLKDHEFWLGTLGDGLFFFNTKTQSVKNYDKSEGLPNNVIYGVEWTAADPNHLWLSTNRGVVAMNLKTKQFNNFTEKDGLMSNELNLGASYVSKKGDVYFGGIQGYNYIPPQDAFDKKADLRVFFSGIEVENKKVFPGKGAILSSSIAYTDKIVLPYNQRSLKLNFFANDLSNPDRIEYKYIMRGDDEVEEILGSSNELRFASIAPGNYKLSVYARTANGEWNSTPAELTISVEKPFWLHWWFIILMLLLFVLIVIFLVRKSIDKERRLQVRLEMKIAERTRELRRKTDKIEQQKTRLEEQTQELEQEKEKSERLLNNILPKETASQLKKDGRSAARDFSMVSIMFTDFVGFTNISENMKAKDLVTILDKHFRKFDEIIEKNDLEKIKTIGDAYMCAGGVPIRNKTNPINTVLAAVQIKQYMLDQKEIMIQNGEQYWTLRIGINTGAVSAGVIGTKRYAYDVWGSTVNRAQRMEQMCEPEKIAITAETFEHIEPYFECKKIGKVLSKSGLKIMMYEVMNIKPELSKDDKGIEPNDAFHKLVNLHHYSTINYYKAERYILNKLQEELSPKLHYHSYDHSKDVTRQAERIAIGEGITDEDLFLLKSAASYHDAGFVEQYDKNEPIGARMAAEILPSFGYTKAHIERIKELIYVTQIPHQPKNKLEEIICDADLDYLGRDDFHEIADRLRRELREHGKIDSDRQWDEIQVSFLKQHRYFTRTSIQTRKPKKMQNLTEIELRLKKDNYKD